MAKGSVVNVRIDPELKEAACKAAKADGRTLSNWVANLIKQALAAVAS